MPPPLVSVVVAAYNAERWIGAALDSVLGQTEPRFELIVCDDGSTDRTAAIAAAYADRDKRILLLRNAENRGAGYTRNRCLGVAKGTWVCILDADDFFHSDRLRSLLAIAERRSIDILFDNLRIVSEDGIPLGIAVPGIPVDAEIPVTAVSFIKSDCKIPYGYGYLQPFIRRSFLIENSLIYCEKSINEDFYFSVLSLSHKPAALLVGAPLYFYRQVHRSRSRAESASLYERARAVHLALAAQAVVSNSPDVLRALDARLAFVEEVSNYLTIMNAFMHGHLLKGIRLVVQTRRRMPNYMMLLAGTLWRRVNSVRIIMLKRLRLRKPIALPGDLTYPPDRFPRRRAGR
jgi:glycosyltransferase involved in cell wall biosynthesis